MSTLNVRVKPLYTLGLRVSPLNQARPTHVVDLTHDPVVVRVAQAFIGERGPAGSGSVPPVLFGFGSVAQSTLLVMPQSGVITEVVVDVETEFNGIGALLGIGVAGALEALMPTAHNALWMTNTYSVSPMRFVAAGTPIVATYTAGLQSSSGVARIYFVINPS